jgi:hypothetical protein
MFLAIEGDMLINLTLISRVEFNHKDRTAKLFNAGVYEAESHIAYEYFTDPANKKALVMLRQLKQAVP